MDGAACFDVQLFPSCQVGIKFEFKLKEAGLDWAGLGSGGTCSFGLDWGAQVITLLASLLISWFSMMQYLLFWSMES